MHSFILMYGICVFFYKQNTAYDMRISDWSSDVCSSDLEGHGFKLKVESLPDRQFEMTKRMAAVPERFYGCHTLAVDGYVVEGLVPIDTLAKLDRKSVV